MHRRLAAPCLCACLLSACVPRPEALPDCARPLPVVSRTFLLFFDPHDDALSPRAETILTALAVHWRRYYGASLEVDGHVDTAEQGPADRTLGGRRAGAVAMFLMGQGVAPERLRTVDQGAAQPLVPTPPGTTEAQNRFASFVMRGEGDGQEAAERAACEALLRRMQGF